MTHFSNSSNKDKKIENSLAIASVEPIIDHNNHSIGTLNLIKTTSHFYLRYLSSKTEAMQIKKSIFQSIENFHPDGFTSGASFEIVCQNICSMAFYDSPNSKEIKIIIYYEDLSQNREFIFKQNLNQLTEFIYQLFLNGIAVPSFGSDDSKRLEFYKECNPNQFLYNSINIQPIRRNFENFAEFWIELIQFSESFIKMLYKRNALTHNSHYPIIDAVLSDQKVFLDRISDFLSQKPSYTIITKEEFPTLFDEKGTLKNPEEFRERIFFSGIEEEVLPEAMPFIFRLYSDDSTTESRMKQDQENDKLYENLSNQVDLIKLRQLKRNKSLYDNAFKVIEQDVLRTDREAKHQAFKVDHGPGMKLLIRLLSCYCLYNQSIGYVQGMNDLFVPIILSYMPQWNDESKPVDQNNEVIGDYEKYMPRMFWIYDAMLNNIAHEKFLTSITTNSRLIAKKAVRLLKKFIPLIEVWLKINQIQYLLFMYHDFVYLYKRQFSNLWEIWFMFHCSPDPHNWFVYFIAAILVKTIPSFKSLYGAQEDSWLAKLIKYFPKCLMDINPDEVRMLALWFCKNSPISDDSTDDEIENNDDTLSSFKSEFFDVDYFNK